MTGILANATGGDTGGMTMTKSRKPNRFEMSFLFTFHGALTGGIMLTYFVDEDIFFLHQFAGYVVCVAILVRLFAATLAPKNSPLALSWPKLFAPRQGGRSPLLAWMAVALITTTALAAFSGLLAESIGFGDLHEALAEGVLPVFIFAHIAIVAWRTLSRRLGSVSAEDLDKATARAQAYAGQVAQVTGQVATKATDVAVRRLKPYLQGHR